MQIHTYTVEGAVQYESIYIPLSFIQQKNHTANLSYMLISVVFDESGRDSQN